MGKYVRDISHIFHDYNHTKVNRKFYKCMDSSIYLNTSSFPFVIKNKIPGIYTLFIGGILFAFNLKYVLSGDDNVTIYSRSKAICTVNGQSSNINLYEVEEVSEFSTWIIDNTVNDIFDCIIFEGNTIIELANGMNMQTPYDPADIKSIDEISIKTNSLYDGKLTEEEYSLNIRLRNNLKRLNENICDIFVIDSQQKFAYIMYKVGELELTGTENIEYVDGSDMDNSLTFFVNCEFASSNATSDNILSNYFKSYSCDDILDMVSVNYGVSLSNDISKKGFYIRIPKTVIDNINNFYNIYTCYILKNDKYVKISTLSQKEIDAINPESQDVYVLSSGIKYIKLSDAIKDYDYLYKFKKYLGYVYRTNPVTIEYLLADYKYKTELLDEYCVKTFYPKTRLKVSCNNGNISIMTKTLT